MRMYGHRKLRKKRKKSKSSELSFSRVSGCLMGKNGFGLSHERGNLLEHRIFHQAPILRCRRIRVEL